MNRETEKKKRERQRERSTRLLWQAALRVHWAGEEFGAVAQAK